MTKSTRLSRDRILAAAVELADRIGVEALTIRRLAGELGTGAMSIYHHLPNKDAILDGMVDLVFAEIDSPPAEQPWPEAVAHRCRSAREVLVRHSWAVPLLESRASPGPATLAHHEAMIECLRSGGLSLELTAQAYATLDAFVYGFVIQEASLPAPDEIGQVAEGLVAQIDETELPRLREMSLMAAGPDYRFADNFEVGLSLIIEGLQRRAEGA